MTVVNKLANGATEIFETQNYIISMKPDTLHPLILSVTVYDGGRRIGKFRRRHAFWYKHVTFKKPEVQEKLRAMQAAKQAEQQSE